ncbi:MAG: hypothetical protein ACOWWR_18005 [Eubacteriales bacterium]
MKRPSRKNFKIILVACIIIVTYLIIRFIFTGEILNVMLVTSISTVITWLLTLKEKEENKKGNKFI